MILTGVNLQIDAAKVAAIVGRSRSGKSTIIKLIERFYDTSSGSIDVDSINIKSYNLRALRSHVALVSQEPTLFAGTIRDNIAYAKENATEAEIIEAATIANAHDFIRFHSIKHFPSNHLLFLSVQNPNFIKFTAFLGSSMEDGYETYRGERGVQLSGGQKQRIALARAILKNNIAFR